MFRRGRNRGARRRASTTIGSASHSTSAFAQGPWVPFARPGHFNDADMLVVGQVELVGPVASDEAQAGRTIHAYQFVVSAVPPLLLGCDLEKLDAFTLGLLSNDEVLEVDQDTLVQQAVQVGGEGDLKVHAKPMDDWVDLPSASVQHRLSQATVTANWSDLKISGGPTRARSRRQKDSREFLESLKQTVASHGVVSVRIFSNL